MKKAGLVVLLLAVLLSVSQAQGIVRTVDLFRSGSGFNSGDLTLIQDARLDTLISRHIESNRLAGGIEGYRIQVFRRGGQTAREEADRVMARVLNQFPEIKAYLTFQAPNFYLIRLGDFRTRIEAAKALTDVRKAFPDSYIIKETVNFSEIIL
jgi:hypothetical protein